MANAESQPTDEIHTQSLGKELDYFPIRCQSLKRWLVLILCIFLILGAAVFSLIHIFNAVNAIQSHGRAVILTRFSDTLLALCIVLPLGIVLLILAAINWQNGLTLNKHGFILRMHSKERTWFWRSIRQFDNQVTFIIFSGNTIGKRRTITLKDDQQKTLRIGNKYERMDELTSRLREMILPELFTRSRGQLLRGELLAFHQDLIAFIDGLQIKTSLVPWRDLQISISKNGRFSIKNKRDQTHLFKSKVNCINNLDVLMYILENPPSSKTYASPK